MRNAGFLPSVDAYGVGILLPDIAHDLDISELEAAAVITASAIGCAAPLLLAGRLADRVGSRRLLLVGVRNYFEVPLARGWQIFRDAYASVSGLARSVRGPSMRREMAAVSGLRLPKCERKAGSYGLLYNMTT